MDICNGPLADVMRVLNSDFGWRCEPISDDRATLYTGRRFPDSEPVEVHVAMQGGIVVLSDGGEVLARLASAGFDLDDQVNQAVFRETLWEHRVSFENGFVHLTASVESAAHLAAHLADAIVGLDTLRLIAVPKDARAKTFADTVEDYLRTTVGDDAVTRSPQVAIDGLTVRPTLRVISKTGPIFVQATATTALNHAFEHAFYMFSLLDRAGIPKVQRLAVLGGSETTWTRPRLDVLAEVAYVGLWSDRQSLSAFLAGRVSGSGLLSNDPGPDGS